MHVDERSAGFFALGLAKATAEPVALVATSGTAVVNFMPAVVEAFFGRVPLLLLTADRPHEFRDVGNNQTIDQVRLYGTHVKWFVDMALPEASETMVRYARTVASRAVATARAVPAGPVHLNFPFREPLIPLPGAVMAGTATDTLANGTTDASASPGASRETMESAIPWQGRRDGSPYTRVVDMPRTLSSADAFALATEWAGIERGVFVCGPGTPVDAASSLLKLADVLGWPVLADPLSGLRTRGITVEDGQSAGDAAGDSAHDNDGSAPDEPTDDRVGPSEARAAAVIDVYDVFLRNEDVVTWLAPRLIVRFGALPVSKPLLQYLQRYADVPQIVVDEGGGWRDPTLSTTAMLHVEPRQLCAALAEVLTNTPLTARTGDSEGSERLHNAGVAGTAGTTNATNGTHETSAPGMVGPTSRRCALPWTARWRRLNTVTRNTLLRAVDQLPDMFEGRVFQELAQLLPDGAALYVGNSMPIRDMDAFFPVVDRRIEVFGNRGASGIDGVVSSALGASAGTDGPLVLVLGDLSFYHDLNGLLAAKLHDLNVTIVVINNDGGGIFSFLPQAEHGEHFELLFGTPIGLDFEPTVRMYGGTFTRVDHWDQFRRAVKAGMAGDGLHVVEIVTQRTRNAEQHRTVIGSARTAATLVIESNIDRQQAPPATGWTMAVDVDEVQR